MRKDFGPKSWVYPAPVLMIGTYDEEGIPNIMNAAWGCAYDTNQVELNISDEHRTTENIKKRKSLTISLANFENMVPADYVGLVSAKDVKDKFERTKWKSHKSEIVDAPILDDLWNAP